MLILLNRPLGIFHDITLLETPVVITPEIRANTGLVFPEFPVKDSVKDLLVLPVDVVILTDESIIEDWSLREVTPVVEETPPIATPLEKERLLGEA